MATAVEIQKIISELTKKTGSLQSNVDENEIFVRGILGFCQYFNQGTLSLIILFLAILWLISIRIKQVRSFRNSEIDQV